MVVKAILRRAPSILIFMLAFCALTVAAAPERVVDPRYSVPLALHPGSYFNATIVAEGGEVQGAWIIAPGLNYSLRIVGSREYGGLRQVLLQVPEGVPSELYDLYLMVGGELVWEPRCIWVLERPPDKLVLIHTTDIHIDLVSDGVHSSELYETVINLLNTLPVDAMVATGDLVDVGGDLASLRLFADITNRARRPTFLLPGNHDHSQTDARSFEERYYGFYVGPSRWYRVVGDFLLVAMDSGIDGFVGLDQLEWLETILETYSEKTKILMFHHPVFEYGVFTSVEGSWESVDSLSNIIYYSWRDHMDSVRRLFQLIDKYDVRLLLSGHVHGDGLVVYNGRTWFVTTTTTCAGVREQDYRGFRIVEVTPRTVTVYGLPGTNPLRETSSFNVDKVRILTVRDPTLSAVTAIVNVSRGLGIELANVTVVAYLNSSVAPTQYRLYGDAGYVLGYALKSYGSRGYAAYMTIDVTRTPNAAVTLASYPDEEGPTVEISLYTPKKPVAGKDILTVYIKARDSGWGLSRVELVYRFDGREKTAKALWVGEDNYEVTIPPLNTSQVTLMAVARDLSGHEARSGELVIKYTQPTPPAGEQPGGEAGEQPPEEKPPAGEQPPQPSRGIEPTYLVGIALVAVIAVVAVILLTRRRR